MAGPPSFRCGRGSIRATRISTVALVAALAVAACGRNEDGGAAQVPPADTVTSTSIVLVLDPGGNVATFTATDAAGNETVQRVA